MVEPHAALAGAEHRSQSQTPAARHFLPQNKLGFLKIQSLCTAKYVVTRPALNQGLVYTTSAMSGSILAGNVIFLPKQVNISNSHCEKSDIPPLY